jgi:chromosome segregation ATPase
MKYVMRFTLLLAILPACSTVVYCQTPASAQQSVESLRAQLADLGKKQEELQTRARRLDEDLKPENIERYFALNGSTHPEELREQRRRQLENEKANVQQQLDQLATSRARLETSIAAAEAASYRQSGYTNSAEQPSTINAGGTVKPKPNVRRARRQRVRRAKRRG